METHGRFLNVVDVEATCWSGKQPADRVWALILQMMTRHTWPEAP